MGTLDHGGAALSSVLFSPDGAQVATTVEDGPARVWNTSTAKLVAQFAHGGVESAIAFSPSGRWLITPREHGAAIWEAATGRALITVDHPGAVHDAAFAGSDIRVVTGGRDGTVRVFTCEVCRPLEELVELAESRTIREGLTEAERAQYLGAGSG